MKKQQQDFNSLISINKSKHMLSIVVLLVGTALFFSCSNTMEEVNALTRTEEIPSLHSYNIEVIQTDSGLISFKMFAPELKRFEKEEEPYIEFPQGITVYGYDYHQNIMSSIKADYAKHFEEKNIWIAERDVVAINKREGNQLNTEYMVWDVGEKKLYSDKFSRITTKDGVFYGQNGFEADDTFSKWKLLNTKGTINVKDE